MNKKEKELVITDIWREYIKEMDGLSTVRYYKDLIILGAIGAFIYGVYPSSFSFLVDIGVIVIILSSNQYAQDGKYFTDLYFDLTKSVKEDKVFEFKPRKRDGFETYFYYKRRS